MMSDSKTTTLRILAINDVYELENFASFATLVKSQKNEKCPEIDKVIVTLAGDFISPSQLSSLDHGKGMVEVLNACGVDFACIGSESSCCRAWRPASPVVEHQLTTSKQPNRVHFNADHESDVPHTSLLQRLDESAFLWLNSNLPNFVPSSSPPELAAKAPEISVIQVGSKKVGLIGLCGMTSAMKKNPGIPPESIEAFLEPPAALSDLWKRYVRNPTSETDKLDLIIPLTHQGAPEDNKMMEEGEAPLLLAGHEHEVIIEQRPVGAKPAGDMEITVAGRKYKAEATKAEKLVVKAGCDAQNVVSSSSFAVSHFILASVLIPPIPAFRHQFIIDVTWTAENVNPSLTYALFPTSLFARDPAVSEIAATHLVRLAALGKIPTTFLIPDTYLPLSGLGNRRGPTTFAKMLCSIGRDALGADVCVINGACFREERAYEPEPEVLAQGGYMVNNRITITYSSLLSVLPFPTLLLPVHLPGSVLLAAIRQSRSNIAIKGYANGYLQTDDGVVFSAKEATTEAEIATIKGKPFDPDRTYSVAVLDLLLDGLEHITPLEEWAKANSAELARSRDDARGLKELCIAFFARMWWRLLPAFDDLDTDNDGYITCPELRTALSYILSGHYCRDNTQGYESWPPEEKVALEKVVDALFGMVDTNADGKIPKDEYLAVVGGRASRTLKLFEQTVRDYRGGDGTSTRSAL